MIFCSLTISLITDAELLYWWVSNLGHGKVRSCRTCKPHGLRPSLSKRIAAFALVSGAVYVDQLPCNLTSVKIPCNPGRCHIPMLEFHGGNDTIINYLGGERKQACLPTIPHWEQEWALRDELSLRNRTIHLTNDTLLYTHGEYWETGLVQHIYEPHINHDWPSTVVKDDKIQIGHILLL